MCILTIKSKLKKSENMYQDSQPISTQLLYSESTRDKKEYLKSKHTDSYMNSAYELLLITPVKS